MAYFVYLLLCDQKTYYVGSTSDVCKRFNEHKNKQSFFTKKFSDLKLIYTEQHKSRTEAEKRERQIKGWSLAKKQALATGDIEKLKILSKSH
jgi:putative endonuclease